jgi:hypothetical protein
MLVGVDTIEISRDSQRWKLWMHGPSGPARAVLLSRAQLQQLLEELSLALAPHAL